MNREEFIYLTPYLLSLALSSGIFIYTWQHRFVRGARVYAWFVAGQILTILGFILELISPDLETKLLWDKFQWLTVSFLVFIPFLMFSVQFSEHKLHYPRLAWGYWLGLPMLFTLLLLTDDLHHLLYPNPHLSIDSPFPELQYDFTIIVYAYSLFYIYGANFYGIGLLIRRALQPHNLHRGQYWTIAVGFLIPVALSIISLLDLQMTPYRDIAPITFAIGNLIVAWGLFRYSLFDLVPIARERVLENLTDAIIVLDASNRVVDMNQVALANVGKTSPEVIGHPVQEVFAEWSELMERIPDLADAALEVSATIQGERKIYDLSISSIRDHRSLLIGRIFVAHDITRRKMLEERYRLLSEQLEQRVLERTESLRESEARLQAAIDAADIGFWDWDLASGNIVSLGHHDKLFGFAPGEFKGTYSSFEKRVHPADRDELNRVVQLARDDGSEYAHEYRIVWPDGSIHWIAGRGRFEYNETGEPVRMRGAVLDITERKQTEEQVSLLQTILMDVSTARDLSSSLWVLLRRVCEKTGWVYGQAWLPRPDESILDCGPAWFSDSSLEEFRAISKSTTFRPGEGLPGRVWLSKQPAWLEDATLDPNFPRVESAAQIGLKAALAIPIMTDSGIVAVIEFFLREPRKEDERRVNVIVAVAAQLGLVIERKWAEERLRREKHLTEQIINSLPGVFYVFDEQSRFHRWNKNFERVTGYSGKEMTQISPLDLFTGEDQKKIEECVQNVFRKGNSAAEVDFVAKDGTRTRYYFTGRRVQLDGKLFDFGMGIDITERRRTEEALRESEQRLSLIYNSTQEYIVLIRVDGKDNYIMESCNEAYIRANQEAGINITSEQLAGMSVLHFMEEFVKSERAKIDFIFEKYQKAITTGNALQYNEETRLDGTMIYHETTLIPILDTAGQYTNLLYVSRDVTERKRAEEEMRQHAARMEMLAEISQALAEVGLDVQAVFDTIARFTAEHIGDSCAIRLLSDDEQWFNLVAFHHPIPETAALLKPYYLTPMPARQEWFRQVLQTGQSLVLPVISREQIDSLLPAEFQLITEQFPLHSGLIVPLRADGRVIGTIALTRVDPAGPSYTANDQVLVQELADRAALTIQNAQLFEQAETARERLAAFSHRLLEVQEAERRALTTELHDRVGQNLTGLSINLQNMKALASDKTALKLAPKFDDAQALVQDTTRQIRDIMAELHLPELEDYGLAAALEIYAERAASRGNLELVADLPDLTPARLPSEVNIALFRAAQEAINNVLKHAEATRLEVSLEKQDGRVRLKIEDDGRGFESDAVSQKEAQTWGLKIMRERIESIGGDVQIESEPGAGTRVIFEIERLS